MTDDSFLLFRSLDRELDWDIWAMPLDGDRKPVPVVRTRFEERDAQFSPDGRWIAYQSNESGRFEIYAQPFPGDGENE
jgi:Tol biopolymer transport system component